MIYFDASATTPLLPEAREAMVKLMDLSISGNLGNASSLHTAGSRAKGELIRARTEIAKLIGVPPLELILTSSGSESNNTVLHTFEHCPIFVSAIEHPSVLRPAEEYGNPCIKVPVNEQGTINLNYLKLKLTETAKADPKQKILVSIMLANNEIGTVEPIRKVAIIISELRKQGYRNIYLHTDATQAIGKIPVDAKKSMIDYLTFTAHKLGGPIGIAALYVRTGAPFRPLILGGSQENKRRAGTSNVVLAAGFAAAAKYSNDNKTWEKYLKIKELRNYLAERIMQIIPSARIITPLNNLSSEHEESALPNILNVSFPAAEGESTQLYLDLNGIEVSTGSACASGALEPSHVLMAMFHDAEVAHDSVRFSFNLDTTKQQIDVLLDKIPGIIAKIQDLSTLNKESYNERQRMHQ